MKHAKLVAIVAAVMVALLVAVIPVNEAKAENLKAQNPMNAPNVVMPYVDDVNPWGAKSYAVTLTTYGCSKAKTSIKVMDCKTKKLLKLDLIYKKQWVAIMKKGRTYKITATAKGTKSMSIYYGVC